jgi:hypothetical protein
MTGRDIYSAHVAQADPCQLRCHFWVVAVGDGDASGQEDGIDGTVEGAVIYSTVISSSERKHSLI